MFLTMTKRERERERESSNLELVGERSSRTRKGEKRKKIEESERKSDSHRNTYRILFISSFFSSISCFFFFSSFSLQLLVGIERD